MNEHNLVKYSAITLTVFVGIVFVALIIQDLLPLPKPVPLPSFEKYLEEKRLENEVVQLGNENGNTFTLMGEAILKTKLHPTITKSNEYWIIKFKR